uniref:Uncharacterized protein n=1 Tax=Trichinella nativa TaxID=6335 RepID=A0A0V1KIF8_9BILA
MTERCHDLRRQCLSYVSIAASQGKNSRQELGGRTEVETMEECCLLAFSLWW